MTITRENFEIQRKLTAIVLIIFFIKILAWYFTNSVAILTDTLEYTINVVAGFIGLYSLYVSSKPKDSNHPYGHGKVEFLSASVEGLMMILFSFIIIYEAINNLTHPHELKQLDFGIYLVLLTGIINYGVGYYSIKKGKKNNSLALIATGKHMQSDTYATIGIVIGLVLIYFTHYAWIDSAVAFIFAIIIITSGYRILRNSIAGIMDEADYELLGQVVSFFNINREENWIDLHNLRIKKYGGTLNLTCHLTLPWYISLKEGHLIVDRVEKMIDDQFDNDVEVFIHTDSCLPESCKICQLKNCNERQFEFIKKIDWTVENISNDLKHTI